MLRTLLALCAALLVAQPATARWLVAETEHFRIHSDGDERMLREQAARLEDYRSLLGKLTGRTMPSEAPKLDIYSVGSRADLLRIAPRAGPAVAGFYTANLGGILAVILRPSRTAGGADLILQHEYAHHFMFQTGAAALPAWYVEGFAEYMMSADFRPDRITVGTPGPGRWQELQGGSRLPMERLLAGSCATLPRGDCGNFYAQSWLLTHYMFRAEGMLPKLRDYLGRVARGEASVPAFRAAVAGDLDAFGRGLFAYMNSTRATMTRISREPPKPADVRITALPRGADDILVPLVAMTLPQRPEDDRASLERIRAAAAKVPGDAFAERALAIGESIGGDRAAGGRRLDALLAAAPEDAELLRWRAQAHLAAGTPDARTQARRLLVRAHRAAPSDWRVLHLYARTFPPREMPTSVIDVWTLAARLAPQVKPLGVEAAFVLARAGRFEAAYAAIAPAVFDPHAPNRPPLLAALAEALRAGNRAAVDAAPAGIPPSGCGLCCAWCPWSRRDGCACAGSGRRARAGRAGPTGSGRRRHRPPPCTSCRWWSARPFGPTPRTGRG